MRRLLYILLLFLTLPVVAQEELCIDGILLFREDFGGNDPNDPIVGTQHVPGMDYSRYTQRLNADHVTGHPGLFWLIKSGYYHADTTGGRDPMRNHSNWYLQDDHTYPNDKTRGYLLEIDGMGGTAPFYSTVVQGVCPGMRLTFSAYVANVNKASNYIDGIHARVYPKLKFEIEDAKTHTVLGSHSTGDIPYDPDLTVNTDFWYSSKWYLHGMTFTMPEAVDSIRLTIYNDVMNNGAGNDFALDDIEIRLCYMPAKKIVQDTIICDTIDNIVWRNNIYPLKNELRDTVYDSSGADSIYYILNVIMEHCCPEIKEKTITIGTICDTLLPYTLYLRDTVLTFKMAGDLLLEFQHPQWDCIDSIYTLHLDTIHCERLYDIIVNKYNWQLLCDNVALRKFFPERMATAFQWYKNEQPISGATDDDYAEQNELCGVFQLNVKLDDGRSIWSNIIEIKAKDEIPIRVQIYNSQGMPVSEEQLSQGVYLFRYERGDEVWIEKKWIP